MIRIRVGKDLSVYGVDKIDKRLLRDKFTVTNPVYIDNKKMGRSNKGVASKLKAYSESKNKVNVPVGALDEVLETFRDRNKKVKITDNSFTFPIKYRFTGELKDVQQGPCTEILKHDRGLLQAPTGAGKTVMGLYCIAKRNQKTIIIVHTSDLADQWVERIMQFLGLSEVEIGRIGNSKFRIGRKITVALVQSLYKNPEELKGIFGMTVVDECHRTPGRTFTDALSFLNTRYRLGLTATPYRNDGLNKLIYWYVGPIRCRVNEKELIANGDILVPKFIIRETDFWSERNGVWDYVYLLKELTEDEKRNQFICDDIANEFRETDDCMLILSDRKTHCDTLVKLLEEEYGIEPLLLTGDVNAGWDRKSLIAKIGKTERVVVATGQLIGEGFDCKELNQMFLTTPMKFKGRVTQYIGRVMRPAPGKTKPTVWDYADWNINVLAKSARARIAVYGSDNIEYS